VRECVCLYHGLKFNIPVAAGSSAGILLSFLVGCSSVGILLSYLVGCSSVGILLSCLIVYKANLYTWKLSIAGNGSLSERKAWSGTLCVRKFGCQRAELDNWSDL